MQIILPNVSNIVYNIKSTLFESPWGCYTPRSTCAGCPGEFCWAGAGSATRRSSTGLRPRQWKQTFQLLQIIKGDVCIFVCGKKKMLLIYLTSRYRLYAISSVHFAACKRPLETSCIFFFGGGRGDICIFCK